VRELSAAGLGFESIESLLDDENMLHPNILRPKQSRRYAGGFFSSIVLPPVAMGIFQRGRVLRDSYIFQ
jgi:hypothetical protein